MDADVEISKPGPNIVQSVTEETKIAPKPRKKLVDKGLQFWTTKGTKMSTEEKIKYLKSKGLTENEIFTVKTNGENELYKLKIQGMMDNPETYYKRVDGADGGQNSTKKNNHHKHHHKHRHHKHHHK